MTNPFYALLLLALTIGLTQSQVSPNLIKNGNFAVSTCKDPWCIFTTNGAVQAWTPEPQIEIGNGQVYSDFIKNEKVLELAPNSNGCVSQVIENLQPGIYELKFDHAATKLRTYDDCMFSVSFNQTLLKQITPINYQINTEIINVQVTTAGDSNLKFCSYGGQNNSHGALIKSIGFFRKSDLPITTQPTLTGSASISASSNLIVNGNFANSACKSQWCIFKTKDQVEGWIPDPEIEIGNGQVYSDFIKNEKVVKLSPNANGCIYQIVKDIQPGNYELRFDHAARKALAFDDCLFTVSFDGKPLREYRHVNYQVNSEKIDIEVQKPSNASLRFCSYGGVSNGLGAIIKNVNLVKKTILPGNTVLTSTVSTTLPDISSTNVNLLINGDFKQNLCKQRWCLYKSNNPNGVPGWIADPDIQIGYGDLYNQVLGQDRVIELSSSTNTCFKQKIANAQSGDFKLEVNYAARTSIALTDSKFTIEVNQKVETTIIPVDYKLNSIVVDIKHLSNSDLQVRLCGHGNPQHAFGVAIKSVTLTRVSTTASHSSTVGSPVPATSNSGTTTTNVATGPLPVTPSTQNPEKSAQSNTNLLLNGDFKENICKQDWCVYKSDTPNAVTGWTADPQIQIGYGTLYNSLLGKDRVVELASHHNTCIKQKVANVQPGNYKLEVISAAKSGKQLDESQFTIEVNQKILKTINPTDFKITSTMIDLKYESKSDVQVRLCGIGEINNSYGAAIKEVKLTRESSATAAVPTPAILGTTEAIATSPLTIVPEIYHLNPNEMEQFMRNQIEAAIPKISVPILQNPLTNSLILKSHSGTCFQRSFNFQGGDVNITFDYKILSNTGVKDSTTFITVDGVPIYKALPCDDGRNLVLQGSLTKGPHVIGFCPTGALIDQPHQISISKISLTEKQCSGVWSKDLIVNGGFEQNLCKQNYCIYKEKTVSSLPGWISNPEIEICKASIYNPVFGNTWVSEMAGNLNTCIGQKLALKNGKIAVSFDWAGRFGMNVQNKGLDLRLNGKVLQSFKATDMKLNKQSLKYTVTDLPTESLIQFCGTGVSNSYALLIDNVKLTNFDECATSKITQY